MAALGFREGNNFVLEHVRVASIEGYDAAFRELASRDVNILVAFGNEVAAAAARAAAQGRPSILSQKVLRRASRIPGATSQVSSHARLSSRQSGLN